jgi:hypothetical protein
VCSCWRCVLHLYPGKGSFHSARGSISNKFDCAVLLQDGANTNNIITVLPRDATDNAVRERLLSQTGERNANACFSEHQLCHDTVLLPPSQLRPVITQCC